MSHALSPLVLQFVNDPRPAKDASPVKVLLPILLVLLAIVFAVLAALYATGHVELLTSTGVGPHYKHAILLGVLAVLALIAANFARRSRFGQP